MKLERMSIQELLAQIRSQGEHETYPTATEADVGQTETALGVTLPASFKDFVRTFSNGAYLFMLQEVSAVGEGNAQIGAIQNVVANGFPAEAHADVAAADGGVFKAKTLIPFSLDSNGNCWCFVTSKATPEETPVAYCDTEGLRLVGELPSFEAWLRLLVDEQDEVIRALGFTDELGLG